MSKNRVAIYIFYDKDGIVDRYVTYMLQELQKVCSRLIIVCNGVVTDEGKQALGSISSDLIIRSNDGFDAWGFKKGLELIGWDELSNYDELVLMNDTVYGPFYPFQTIFDEMEAKELDFWGITKHGQIGDPYGLTKDGIFPEHIQSYFFAINKNMFSSSDFMTFWDELPEYKTWKDAVSLHEVQFTRHFAERGFKWDVYVDTEKRFKGITETCLLELATFELLKQCKLPVMKRKNFSTEYDVVIGTTIGDSTKKAFDYISKNTDYDVDLIWENILRTVNLRTIKDNLDLNYILPHDYVLPPEKDNNNQTTGRSISDLKIAVFMHITYDDQVEFCKGYANSVPENTDVYVTTNTEEMKEKIQQLFSEVKCKQLKVILLPKSHRGRDVSALWVALRPYMKDYDYICYTHNKKSKQDRPLTIGRGFAISCFENNLASKEYIENLLNVFENNPRLGMLFPPPVIHGRYYSNITNQWGSNYKKTVELAKKLDINVPIDKKDPIFPAGGMFWFRPEALKKLMDIDWKFEDFPGEPLSIDRTLNHAFERIYCFAAQSEGYYSAWVMTLYNARVEITSLNYLLTAWHVSSEES